MSLLVEIQINAKLPVIMGSQRQNPYEKWNRGNGRSISHFFDFLVFVSSLFVDGGSVISLISELQRSLLGFFTKSLANWRLVGATFPAIQCFRVF
jgi:hypothetical protein